MEDHKIEREVVARMKSDEALSPTRAQLASTFQSTAKQLHGIIYSDEDALSAVARNFQKVTE